MSLTEQRFIATAPRGLSDLLAAELASMGAQGIRERVGNVEFVGTIESGYRACLWSRTASRVLLWLADLTAGSADEFYERSQAMDWKMHVAPGRTLACEFNGTHPSIVHSHYGALRLKDAICDQLRSQTGERPDVQPVRADVRVVAHARGERISLWLDLAGEGLHRRGYRLQSGEAPLRENLAAGVLLRARWPEAAARGAEFLDPLCGAGTLVIEAAMIAAEYAPGLLRDYHGFLGWRQHDAALWERLRAEALGRAHPQVSSMIRGSDADAAVVRIAQANAQRAGVASLVRFEHHPLAVAQPATSQPGLVCTNPPYGERLGDAGSAGAVHAELGRVLRERFTGWEVAILTAAPQAAAQLKLRSYRVHELWNGAIPCRLIRIDLNAPGERDLQAARQQRAERAAASAGAQMFANRLGKNRARLQRLARRAGVSCYRLYDADMPEYAFAIDRYEAADSGAVHLLVQEYAPPASVDAQAARRRREEVLAVLPRVLEVPPEHVHLRRRERQRGAAQYQPMSGTGSALGSFVVKEGGLRFRVNLDEYLDSGLFLDHRLTRARLREHASGTRFLNLFCYTASATVYAAAGGARESLSIDLSNAYLQWAGENLTLNGFSAAQHTLLRADCLEWLRAAAQSGSAGQFDLIFLDPPTFSNSKRMREELDVQRDHTQLIDWCLKLLAPRGLLVFSTNAQRFRLNEAIAQHAPMQDVSRATLPFDFERNPRIHRCYEFRRG